MSTVAVLISRVSYGSTVFLRCEFLGIPVRRPRPRLPLVTENQIPLHGNLSTVMGNWVCVSLKRTKSIRNRFKDDRTSFTGQRLWAGVAARFKRSVKIGFFPVFLSDQFTKANKLLSGH